MLWILKGNFLVKKLVWNVCLKDFWYRKTFSYLGGNGTAQSAPIGTAIVGTSGVSISIPVSTSLTGKNGLAVSAPSASSQAGVGGIAIAGIHCLKYLWRQTVLIIFR